MESLKHKKEFHAWFRYADNQKEYWEGTVETDDFSEEFRISAEKKIKSKDRRVFAIDWR